MLPEWKAGPRSVPPPQPEHFLRDLAENDNLEEYRDYLLAHSTTIDINFDGKAVEWVITVIEHDKGPRRMWTHHQDKMYAIAASLQSWFFIRAMSIHKAERLREIRNGKA